MKQLKIEFLYEHPVHKGYACDEEGNVYSLKNGKIRKLKPANNGNDYLQFDVFKDGKRVAKPRLNRFVWECIKGEIEDGYEVDHLDFDRENNCIDNLLARPASENRTRKSEEGRRRNTEAIKKKWKDEKFRKRYTEAVKKAKSKPVLQFDKQGNLIAEFPSAREAERQTGVSNTHISACCLGKLNSAGGFIWRYAS